MLILFIHSHHQFIWAILLNGPLTVWAIWNTPLQKQTEWITNENTKSINTRAHTDTHTHWHGEWTIDNWLLTWLNYFLIDYLMLCKFWAKHKIKRKDTFVGLNVLIWQQFLWKCKLVGLYTSFIPSEITLAASSAANGLITDLRNLFPESHWWKSPWSSAAAPCPSAHVYHVYSSVPRKLQQTWRNLTVKCFFRFRYLQHHFFVDLLCLYFLSRNLFKATTTYYMYSVRLEMELSPTSVLWRQRILFSH